MRGSEGSKLLTSMTGYGRAQTKLPRGTVVVEMKSVNHRYVEVVPRFPREFFALEDEVRKLILDQVSRGRIEVYLYVSEGVLVRDRTVYVDEPLLQAAISLLKRVSTDAHVDFEPPSTGDLLSIPGLFVASDSAPSVEEVTEIVMDTAKRCLEELRFMREAEGRSLLQHLRERLDDLQQLSEAMRDVAHHSVSRYREKLMKKLEQVMSDNNLDASRIAVEVAMVAERTSVEEELRRFVSHVTQFDDLLLSPKGVVGRRLDFLLQEMNREVNTMGAKCDDLPMVEAVLSAKHILEQMREQVQNVE